MFLCGCLLDGATPFFEEGPPRVLNSTIDVCPDTQKFLPSSPQGILVLGQRFMKTLESWKPIAAAISLALTATAAPPLVLY